MPKKQKPSEWKPIGLFDEPSRASRATRDSVSKKLTSVFRAQESVRSKYTDDVLDSIIEHTDVHDGESREQLKQTILETVTWLHIDLYFQGRPSTVEKRTSLHELREQVIRLRWALHRLDSDTLNALATEADLDPVNPSTEPPRSKFSFQGDIRISETGRGLARLSKWVRGARQTLGTAKRGPPEKAAEFRAACKLAIAWVKAHGGKAPTRQFNSPESHEYGPFSKFANAALSPLGVSVSDDMVKRAISLTNQFSKTPQEE